MAEHGVVAWLAAGLIAGVIAKVLAGGWDMTGCVGMLIAGVTGAMFAGWAWTQTVGFANDTQLDGFAAIAGAIVTLWVSSILFRPR